jgi:hypothetical protein
MCVWQENKIRDKELQMLQVMHDVMVVGNVGRVMVLSSCLSLRSGLDS